MNFEVWARNLIKWGNVVRMTSDVGDIGDLAATELLGLILSGEWMSSSLFTAQAHPS